MNAPENVAARIGSSPIAIALITKSPSNPRQHFDEGKLAELAESVAKHGVLQPILVRPHPSKADAWELVAGERRWRAAKSAGLTEIPVTVRDLTDAEVLEIQVIENLQREDLHELEEAEGYQLLMQRHHYTADDIAHKVGKSKAYVYARLKFTALTPKAREAFYAGKLNASTALLVARIPVPRLQEQALKEITEIRYQGAEPMGVRAAAHHLQEHYMLRLAEAPFPTGDEKLVAKAGTCAACPKRTGNQPELFGDVKGADVCTDPECFTTKKEAHIVRLRAAAEAKGKTVISGKEAKKIIPYDSVDERSGYIELDAKNWGDPKHRTNRALLGKDCPEPVLVAHPQSGKMVEVVATKEVAGALKTKLPKPRQSSGDQQYKARQQKAKLETSINARIFEAIADRHTGKITSDDAKLIAGELLELIGHEPAKYILRVWDTEALEKTKDVYTLTKRFAKRIPDLAPEELVRLLVQLAVVSEVQASGYSNSKPEKLLATAARLGVDVAAIRRELTPVKKEKKAKPSTKARKKSPAKARAS